MLVVRHERRRGSGDLDAAVRRPGDRVPLRELHQRQRPQDRGQPSHRILVVVPGRGPHWSVMSSQAPYRLGDGAPVTIGSARAIWTAVAREVLEEASGTASVAQSELARQVQQRSGVYTRMPAVEWLPAVL